MSTLDPSTPWTLLFLISVLTRPVQWDYKNNFLLMTMNLFINSPMTPTTQQETP
mgnify:CR=1 FL=1